MEVRSLTLGRCECVCASVCPCASAPTGWDMPMLTVKPELLRSWASKERGERNLLKGVLDNGQNTQQLKSADVASSLIWADWNALPQNQTEIVKFKNFYEHPAPLHLAPLIAFHRVITREARYLATNSPY